MNRLAVRILASLEPHLFAGHSARFAAHRLRCSHVTQLTAPSFIRIYSSTTVSIPPESVAAALPDTTVTSRPLERPAKITIPDISEIPGTELHELPDTTYTEVEITVKGRDAPKPLLRFNEYDWPAEVKHVLNRQGFKAPTDIQCHGLPIAMEGRDFVGIAQTGSGKTLSYIIPAVVQILRSEQRNPYALVLGPTRELVQQIQSVAMNFPSLRSVVLYGGSAKGFQISDLRTGPKLIIATPGRLLDLVKDSYVNLRDIKYLVLDEADRMLDMGFEPQIRQVIDHLPKERQTLMWSATWPPDVQELASEFLNDFIQVNVGSTDLHANRNITQHVTVMHDEDKTTALLDILQKTSRGDKVLIFAATKRRVDSIVMGLRRRGYRVDGTHGDKTQGQRESILRAFRGERLDVLVATDVAARGLDVDDIKCVINYDYPNSGEDYVHRIGRTGRRDKKGDSYTFLTQNNIAQAPDLVKIMREAQQKVPDDLSQLAERARETRSKKRGFRDQYATREGTDSYGGSSFGQRGGGYGQRQRREPTSGRYGFFKDRHNPSQHDDSSYDRYGGGRRDDRYESREGNRSDTAVYSGRSDLPTGGNNRPFRSLRGENYGDDDDEEDFNDSRGRRY